MEKFRLVATTAFGLESVAANEIKELGFENVVTENGRVLFDSDARGIVKANLWLRTADRVYILMKEFTSKSFADLFDDINDIPWEKVIPENGNFPVYAKSVKSTLYSLSDIQSIGKKAIVNRLSSHYGKSWFDEDGARFAVTVAILKDRVSVLMDTTGDALHKRGYRKESNKAPLKETLAAALVLISRWKKHIDLIDPLCGSGTILIEAALIGRNIAPGINRRFASEKWPIIDRNVWREERTAAMDAVDHEAELNIEGYDIDSYAIKVAAENAKRAGIEKDIHFQVRDVKDFSTKRMYGYIITNPPYGERLNEVADVEKLYKVMGNALLPKKTWSKYIITSYEGFESKFGDKATKNRKLYNGRIKTYFYQYYGEKPPRRKI